ncbi:hypothetical protein [Nocardia mexicana]|uniref:Ig-like domain-containing protein n=1 Tax=Nocardia mexicana TaxID=279262 RepID=A0A370GZE8_9NOCA|nr:hypothetical protein [Nocardia mexicana]RDI49035.1 hypothetical protein DFR68_107160 [Nocardia mexicana]
MNGLALRSTLVGVSVAALALPLAATTASAEPTDINVTAHAVGSTVTTEITNNGSSTADCMLGIRKTLETPPDYGKMNLASNGNDVITSTFENVAPADYLVTWKCESPTGEKWGTRPELQPDHVTAVPTPVTVERCNGSGCPPPAGSSGG